MSGDALEAADAGRTGDQADHSSRYANAAGVLSGTEVDLNFAALRQFVRVQGGQYAAAQQVGAGHRRAGMAGELTASA